MANRPIGLKRIATYLSYLTATYFVLSGTYFLYVIPETRDIFTSMEIELSSDFLWFANNWVIIQAVNILLLTSVLLISKKLNDLFKYKTNEQDRALYRYLIPKKIKADYQALLSLLYVPLELTTLSTNEHTHSAVTYYAEQEYSDDEIAKSLSFLINEHHTNLLYRAERFIRRMYVFVALVVIFSIYEFINSAYSPIFSLGEVL